MGKEPGGSKDASANSRPCEITLFGYTSMFIPTDTFKCKIFGGGPLGQETGDFLVANGINLYQFYGWCVHHQHSMTSPLIRISSTECGNLNMVLPSEYKCGCVP